MNDGSPRPGLAALMTGSETLTWNDQDVHVVGDPDEWLVVGSGQVDVFAVHVDADGPRGPWHSLCRLDADQVISGASGDPTHRLLLRRVNEAQVLRVHPEDLRRRVAAEAALPVSEQVLHEALADGIQEGVCRAAEDLHGPAPPRDFIGMTDGSVFELRAGDIARPLDTLLWVEVIAGVVEESGDPDLTRPAGDWVCLSRRDWIQVREHARIQAHSTPRMVQGGLIWDRLAAFWSRYLHGVDSAVRIRERQAQDRLLAVTARDRDVLDTVRADNDAFVRAEKDTGSPAGQGVTANHVAAVTIALRALRVDAEVPRQMLQRRDLTDFDDLGSGGWVRTRPLKLEGRWWLTRMGPLVGYWGPDHLPAAFVPADGGYLVRAGWLPEPVRITRENQHAAGKAAWVVYPRLPADVRTVRGLLRQGITGLRGDLWLLGTMASLVGLLGLLTPILNGQILGSFVASANRSMIMQGGVAVIVSALVAGAFSVVQNLVVLRIQGSVTARTQAGVWSRMMDLPVTFFGRFSSGRLGTIVLSVKAAEDVLSGVVVAAGLGLIVAAANILVIFVYSVPLALVALALVATALGTCYLAGRRLVAVERERYDADQRLSAMSYESLSAIGKIRGAAAEERTFLRWSAQQRAVQAKQMESRRIQDVVTVVNAVFPVVGLGVVFTVATLLPTQPSMPALLSFLTAFTLLMNAVLQFTGSVLTAAAMVPMMQSITPILQAQPETGLNKAHPGELSGNLTLRQVSFRYGEDGPMVLDKVDLDIRPGEFVALVGASGSGKSTVVRLMLGFEKPLAGSILFDGQDIGELDLAAVRRQCGVVLQAGALMPGDIRDNIAGGGAYAEDEIWEAASMAGLADVIREMPMGLSTVVNENATGLSGGQVQRLMIARALINRPRIVIFDEATSALDNPTQAVVAEATRQLNATRVVVAHRLSTVQHADRIFVMEAGRVVQSGSYAELMKAEDGPFAGLVRRQAS